ncbi:MAG: GntR family transcriptional regulator [Anaerolineae bacterium]|nr:GntR family transcriptional regulator [Anaerolineae bacterium]
MEKTPLYQTIAETVRKEIVYGTLQPDDELPTVRDMAERWQCAPGTIQRAYHELARQGLVVARPGAGTRVAAMPVSAMSKALRKASLANQTETFLLNMLAAGHAPDDIERAVRMELDRWRVMVHTAPSEQRDALLFVGSHDPTISLIAAQLQQTFNLSMRFSFAGSLGGLIALAQNEADLAGCHLWDAETNTYNRAFVRRLMPGRQTALVKLADRRVGLLIAAGNPKEITGLTDLARDGVRFVNRQAGAGTRVWVDAQLGKHDVAPEAITGYENEVFTHTEVASLIAKEQADTGVGIEAAALAYGLDFIPLTTECYDLVIPSTTWETEAIQLLVASLSTAAMKTTINDLGGYDTTQTGSVQWVE